MKVVHKMIGIVDHSHFLKTPSFTTDIAVNFPNAEVLSFEPLTAQQKHYLLSLNITSADSLIFPKQIHTDIVWPVTVEDIPKRGLFEADAVITQTKGLPIGVRTADCLPVLIHDPVRQAIGAVHAGWKSAYLQIIPKTMKAMHDLYGSQYQDMLFAIGPCIRASQYPVGEEFQQYFPEDVLSTPKGLFLDLPQFCHRQIMDRGVAQEQIWDCGLCSFQAADRFFSFRRQKEQSGRMLNMIVLE